MTVEQTSVVDFISIDPENDELVLSVSDHLEWGADGEHLSLLQDKLNTYLAFVEGGEIFDSYPQARGRVISMNVICKYPLDQLAIDFFDSATGIFKEAGFRLSWEVLEQGV